MDFGEFERKINVDFKNKDFLAEALTHRSYLNENPSWEYPHNERLEFLGDAVLELVVTDFLFNKFTEKPEGELTSLRAALVNTGMLSRAAKDIGLNDHLLLSKGEAKDIGRARDFILANAFEAVVGAIYLDGKYDTAERFIKENIISYLEEVIEKRLFRDAKSLFQERSQETAGITPSYKTLKEWGPDHAKKFLVGVYIGEELIAEGEGESKQSAEQKAAEAGLRIKGWEE